MFVQAVDGLAQVAARRLIGLQVGGAPGEQVPALRGLDVEQAAHDGLQGVACGVATTQADQRLQCALVGPLGASEHPQGQQHGQCHAQRPTPGTGAPEA